MLQPGGEPDLALETLGAHRGAKMRMQHLQGDGAIVAEVVRQPHGGHAAASQLVLKAVAITQRVSQGCDGIGHGARGFGGSAQATAG